MKFGQLAQILAELEKTSSRNEITRRLAALFEKSRPAEIDKICYLLLGELLPAYRGLEFNLAEKMMVQILAAAYGKTPAAITRLYKQKGDLGNVAGQLATPGGAKPMAVSEVYEKLLAVAGETGAGSQERKIRQMAELLGELDVMSAKFVSRMPVGRMRLGFSEATMLDALSLVVSGDKSARPQIERAYNVTADIGLIAREVKSGGLAALKHLTASPGIPIRPALAERVVQAEEIIEKLGPVVAVEPKLDGFRIALHRWPDQGQDKIALFSRNLTNTTLMFPEITAAAARLPAKDFILDGEAIGFDPKTGQFAPFQETMQRKRKYDIAAIAKKIPLTVFVFDVLYLDGQSLLALTFAERRRRLETLFSPSKTADFKHLQLIEQKITNQAGVLEKELAAALAKGLEGIVVKNLRSAYQAGNRGFHWVKLKAGTAALSRRRAGETLGLPDTVDCLVMGAYRGRGARAEFGVGGFLLGLPGGDGRFYSLTRLGSGLSEKQFKESKKRIAALKVKAPPKEYEVLKESVPDIWLKPQLVAEVLADEITLSPRHTAGWNEKTKRGYSLRFPRLVRFRTDKQPADATSISEIERLYRLQFDR